MTFLLDLPNEILSEIMLWVDEGILALIRAHTRFWQLFRAQQHLYFKTKVIEGLDGTINRYKLYEIKSNICPIYITFTAIQRCSHTGEGKRLDINLNYKKSGLLSIDYEYENKYISSMSRGDDMIYTTFCPSGLFIGANMSQIDDGFMLFGPHYEDKGWYFNINSLEKIYEFVIGPAKLSDELKEAFREAIWAVNNMLMEFEKEDVY